MSGKNVWLGNMPLGRITVLAALLAGLLAAAPASFPGSTAPSDHAAVSGWLKAWNTGVDNLDSFLTEDVRFEAPYFSARGREEYRNVMMTSLAALRNVEVTADDLILDGDRGALSWSVSSTHIASGRAVHLRGVSILRFEKGKIAAEWRVYDSADLLRQIGALPDGGDGESSAAAAPAELGRSGARRR